MAPNPIIMQAVEQLGYRVTVGDVAAEAGLNANEAQKGLLALASVARGHLQVAETGDVVYLFPRNFRAILRNKFLQLRLKEWRQKVWGILFYLIRISFGVMLLLSILLIYVAIAIIATSVTSNGNSSNSGFFWIFDPDCGDRRRRRQIAREGKPMNFLEAVFSFLFGDGNPNTNLEKRRWQDIATVIRNNQGAVVAEQIAPYLDEIGSKYDREYEDYMLPVLTRYNGLPEVSDSGDIIYHFPDLQTTAQERNSQPVDAYLRERRWHFSKADRGQILLVVGLGMVNIVGALVLDSLLRNGIAAKLGGFVAGVNSIFWVLLVYGTAFLALPVVRYVWIYLRNIKVEARNRQREERAIALNQPTAALQNKIACAQQFAAHKVIGSEDIIYTTEKDFAEDANC